MPVWSISEKQAAGEAGGGPAELPPTSYPTNRTSEKPCCVDYRSDIEL
ncbi:hypothetical protein ACFLXC_00175 [Chloroflexota bacterium]